MKKEQLHIKVFGRVQGVFFRNTAQNVAKSLNITGFAKNIQDGTVEIIAEGNSDNLDKFLEWVQQGSFLSRVEKFEYQRNKYSNKFQSFEVIRDKNLLKDQLKAFSGLRKNLFSRISHPPKHIVIIPDGNRRWAIERGLPSSEGHRQGFIRIKELLETGSKLGVKVLTIWGFSTENWKRDSKEVEFLFKIFTKALNDVEKEAIQKGIKFKHIGRRDRLPKHLLNKIEKLEEKTATNNKFILNLALDYGGRDEIIRSINKIITSNNNKQIDEKIFNKYLDTYGIPDPDLIIRTSGEQRLSGILPWQGVYSEYYFSPLHFPDFDSEALQIAIMDYAKRQRRFGK